MASHPSAIKRARQAARRTARNTSQLSRVKTAVKRFRAALTGSDANVIQESFQAATRALRKAASKGVMHTRTASRRVGRLAAAHHAASSHSAQG
jgi:small subunit ribosomal protein S20